MRALFLVFSLHLGQEHARGDAWFSADKAKHFFTAALVESASFGGLRSVGVGKHDALIGATAVGVTISIGKEVNDGRTGGDVSPKDLAWDGAGITAMYALLRQTR